MKIYTPPPTADLLRVSIRKQGDKTQHMAFCHIHPLLAREALKEIIEAQKLSIFEAGHVNTVEIRECIANQNGKTISFSFRGLNPHRVKELFLANFA